METKISAGPEPGFEQEYEIQLKALRTLIAGSVLSSHQKQRLENELRNHDRTVRDEIQRLQELSGLDPLTGLLNVKVFSEEAMKYFTHKRRSHDLPHRTHLTLGMADIRSLKFVNDTYGHLVGSALIKTVARILQEGIRETDLPARYGGDEFCFLLAARPGLSHTIATNVKHAIDLAASNLGQEHGWSEDATGRYAGCVDIGLVCVEKDNSPLAKDQAESIFASLVEYADKAMYRSKKLAKSGDKDEITVTRLKLTHGTLEEVNPLVMSL